jgi:hypothetical protein
MMRTVTTPSESAVPFPADLCLDLLDEVRGTPPDVG